MPKHVYPIILTQKDWQKKKGMLAKMAGETGVGDAMDALQAAYEKTNWRIFDPYLALPSDREAQTRVGLAMVIKNAQAEFDLNVKSGVAPALKLLRSKITKAKADFEKSKTIPKKAGEHAGKVLEAVDKMAEEIKKSTLVDELKKGVAQKLEDMADWEKFMKNEKKRLKDYVVAVAKDMKTVKTKEEFATPCWKENIRGVGTTLPNLAKQYGLEEEHKQWRRFASEGFKPKTDEEVATKFDEMQPVLKIIASKLV